MGKSVFDEERDSWVQAATSPTTASMAIHRKIIGSSP
jgi:hypothetical protein